MTLTVESLTKTIDDVTVLHRVSFRAWPGERIVLVGLNGAGKTTLLRIVAGLSELSGGAIDVDDAVPGSMAARAAVSYIPDEPVLYDDLSLAEHMEYVARMHGMEDWVARGTDLVLRLGLEDRIDQLPATFSRGLRQKTSIVLGLIRPCSLLLVDEPFVGLDRPGRAALVDLLDEAAGRGATVVVATHQDDFVARAERCIGLRDGTVSYDGPMRAGVIDEILAGQE